ncbi:hypothetical protein ABZT23_30290 [Streptomyces sp. NPDC005386]
MRGIIFAAAIVSAVTAAVLKAGHWQMHADRHHITVSSFQPQLPGGRLG